MSSAFKVEPRLVRHLRRIGQSRPKAAGGWCGSRQLVAELESWIRFIHGGAVETDDAALVAELALPHLVNAERRIAAAGDDEEREGPFAIAMGWLKRWCPNVSRAEAVALVEVAFEATPLPAAEVARRLKFSMADRDVMHREGRVVRALRPIDETDADRAERRREQARKRKQRQRLKVTNPSHAICFAYENVTPNVTFRPNGTPAAALAAVRDGASTLAEIEATTGAHKAALKMALTRLVAAGLLIRTGRGRYSPVSHNYNSPVKNTTGGAVENLIVDGDDHDKLAA